MLNTSLPPNPTPAHPTMATFAQTDAPRPVLAPLIEAIDTALQHTAPERLPEAVCQALRDHATLHGLLDDTQLAGNPDRYARHVLYAHPAGLFTVVALVWRPGQITPVHGHYTWCSYIILQGAMMEEHFVWNPRAKHAVLTGQVARGEGDAVGSHAGLDTIHRLRNASEDLAVSIHVYGVDAPRVSTHVNRIAALA